MDLAALCITAVAFLTSALVMLAKPQVVEVEETDEDSSEEENTAVLKLIKKSEKKVAVQKTPQATKLTSQVSDTRISFGAGKGSSQPPPAGPPKAEPDQKAPPLRGVPKPSLSEWKPVQDSNIVKGTTQHDFQPRAEGKLKPSGQISSGMAERLAMFQGGQKVEPQRQEAPRRRLVSNAARLFDKEKDDNDDQEDAKPVPRKSVLSRWTGKDKKEDSPPPIRSAGKVKPKEYRRRSDSEEEQEQPQRSRDRRQSGDGGGDRHSKVKKSMHRRKSRKSESESESDGAPSHQQKGKERKQKEVPKRHTREQRKEAVVDSSTNATIDVLSQLIMGDSAIQPAPPVEDVPLGGDNLLHSLAVQTGLVEPKPDSSFKALEDLLSLPPEPPPQPPQSRQQHQPRKASATGQEEELLLLEERDQPDTHSKGRSDPQPNQNEDAPTVINIDISQEQNVLPPQRSKKTSMHMNSASFFVNLPASPQRESRSIYDPAPLQPLPPPPPPPPPVAGPPPSPPPLAQGNQKKHSARGGMPSEAVQADRDELLHQIRSHKELKKVDQEGIEKDRQRMREEEKQQSKSPFVREIEAKQNVMSQSKGSRRSSKHEESMQPIGEEGEPLHQDQDPRSEDLDRRDSLSDKQRRRASQDGDFERDGRNDRRSSTTRQVDDVDREDRQSNAQPEPFPDSGGEDFDAPMHRRLSDLPPPQPITLDDEDEDLPEWKQKLLYQKRLRATAEVRAQKQAKKDEVTRFLGVPEWKVKLIKKKEAERAVVEEAEREQQAERQEKLSRIASMPEWKRKLYMAKNPNAMT